MSSLKVATVAVTCIVAATVVGYLEAVFALWFLVNVFYSKG